VIKGFISNGIWESSKCKSQPTLKGGACGMSTSRRLSRLAAASHNTVCIRHLYIQSNMGKVRIRPGFWLALRRGTQIRFRTGPHGTYCSRALEFGPRPVAIQTCPAPTVVTPSSINILKIVNWRFDLTMAEVSNHGFWNLLFWINAPRETRIAWMCLYSGYSLVGWQGVLTIVCSLERLARARVEFTRSCSSMADACNPDFNNYKLFLKLGCTSSSRNLDW